MIIPDKLLSSAAIVLSDPTEDHVEFVIVCGPDGLYTGKITRGRNRLVAYKVEGKGNFKSALYALLEKCLEITGDEDE